MNFYSAVLAFLLLSFSLPAQNEGITFEKSSWDDILKKAQEEDKLIFLDAYASWCGPCKWMSANVFPQKRVGEYMNDRFVNAKIDMEKGEGPEIANEYGVRAYPTYLIVNGEGKLIHRFCGSMEAQPFLAKVGNAFDEDSNFAAVQKHFRNSDLSVESALNYFTRLDEACMNTDKPAEEVYSSLDEDTQSLKEWSAFMAAYPPKYKSNYFLFALDHAGELEEEQKDAVITGLQSSAKTYLFSKIRTEEYATAVNEVKALDFNTEDVVAETNYFYFRQNKEWGNYVEAADILAKGTQSENGNFLNSAAWTVYQNVEDKKDLKIAIDWIEQALEYEKNYAFMDTYAALLFKSGDQEKAMKVANEAIALAKESGEDYSGTEKLIKEYSN